MWLNVIERNSIAIPLIFVLVFTAIAIVRLKCVQITREEHAYNTFPEKPLSV